MSEAQETIPEVATAEAENLKPCCACPETKVPRDKWYLKIICFPDVYGGVTSKFIFLQHH